MRICGLISDTPRLVGGAELSIIMLFRRLQEEYAHECHLIGIGRQRWTGRLSGVDAEECRDVDEVRARVSAARPDIIFSALAAAHLAAPLAARLGIPHFAWCQSFEYCPPTHAERQRWGVAVGRVYPDADDRKLLATADHVFANSQYLRTRLERSLKVPCAILYPEFDPGAFLLRRRPTRPGRYVTGICGFPYKGADVFFELARRLPETPFLLVGSVMSGYEETLRALPNIRLLPSCAPRRFLTMSRIVLVPSRWPEPFGRIAVEAMANGIATLVSRTGGLEEIVEGAPALSVASFLSADAWLPRVRALLENDRVRHHNGSEGIRLAKRWLQGRSTREFERRLKTLVVRPRAPLRPVVVIRGGAHQATAFAMINARWSETLRRRGCVAIEHDGQPHRHGVDVTIHHDFTEQFGTVPMPSEGHVVAVRTWDFGPYPKAWVQTIVERYDELWVHTRWIRAQAIRAGVPPRRVRVIPLGCNISMFTPRGAARAATKKRLQFVFVGAPILRKGIDILLRAWRAAFTRDDDVSLVIKTHPRDVFYQAVDWRAQIHEQARDAAGAEIVHIDELWPVERLAALYRSSHMAVFPYRAEGFGLPILETMASGCPPIVPRFGACLDFCTSRSARFVRARGIQLPVDRRLPFNTLGFEEEIEEVDFCEISVNALAEALVQAAAMSSGERRRMGNAAAARARQFTWEASAAAIENAVTTLAGRGTPVRTRVARREATQRARRLAVAQALFRAAVPGSAVDGC